MILVRSTRDGQKQIAVWRDVFVLLNKGPATVENMKEIERMILDLAAKHPAGIGGVALVEPDSPPPDGDARQEIRAQLQRLGSRLLGLVYVLEASGFTAAAVRAVLTGMASSSQRPYPTHVVTDLRQGLMWLLPLLDGGQVRCRDIDEALAAVTHARENMPRTERPPPSSSIDRGERKFPSR